jgi:autotransporter-associated beta strand protein
MMTPSSLLHRCRLSALLATAALTAQAQNTTWNNTGANWSSAGSWSTGVPDTNTERAIFTTSGAPSNPNVDGTFTLQGITFSNSLTTAYTFGGTGTLIIDANNAGTTNTIQINGNQTFNVNLTTTNSLGGAQRFVIGTGSGTMNFGAGTTFTVGTGGVSLQATGAGTGEFNFYGLVNLGTNALTQQSTVTPVYFREGSSVTSAGTSGVLSNSAGTMYFETDNVNLGGSASISMIGSLANDAAIYLTRNGLNMTENVRIANTASGQTRTVGVDIAGSGTATWSGNVDISQNTSGADIARTVKFTAGSGDRAVFSGNIISTSGTVFTDALQIDGGGTVVISGTGNTYNAATQVLAGTTLLANNAAGSATGGNSVTVNGTLGGTGGLILSGTNGLTVNSGGIVAPGDGGIESLEVNLAGTTGAASFLSGSTFVFDLNAPGSSDVLSFTGVSLGTDVVFNGNVVNFNNLGGLAPGLYTIMTFDGANAYTGTLAVGTGLGSYTGDFIYNANSIQLNVVPEPSVGVLLLGGMAGAALLRGRRVRRD